MLQLNRTSAFRYSYSSIEHRASSEPTVGLQDLHEQTSVAVRHCTSYKTPRNVRIDTRQGYQAQHGSTCELLRRMLSKSFNMRLYCFLWSHKAVLHLMIIAQVLDMQETKCGVMLSYPGNMLISTNHKTFCWYDTIM